MSGDNNGVIHTTHYLYANKVAIPVIIIIIITNDNSNNDGNSNDKNNHNSYCYYEIMMSCLVLSCLEVRLSADNTFIYFYRS